MTSAATLSSKNETVCRLVTSASPGGRVWTMLAVFSFISKHLLGTLCSLCSAAKIHSLLSGSLQSTERKKCLF